MKSWRKSWQQDVCIAPFRATSSLNRSGMARVNEVSHSFTCHPHVYPRMEWAILPHSPAAAHHRTLAVTHISSHWGQEAELAWVTGYILRWYARPKTVTHPSTNQPGIELTTIESQVRRPNHTRPPSHPACLPLYPSRYYVAVSCPRGCPVTRSWPSVRLSTRAVCHIRACLIEQPA